MRSDRPPRVLMLVENNSYARDTRVRQEAEALHRAGYQVSVVAPRGSGRPWREAINGVRVYSYPAPRPGNGPLGYLWEYGYSLVAASILSVGLLLVHGVDVLHAANPPDTFVAIGVLFRALGKSFVFDHHDLAPELYGARFGGHPNPAIVRALVALENLSTRLADHVIVTNESYRRIALERARVPADRVTVVRNGPDPAVLREVDPHPDVPRDGRVVIGYVGSVGHHDGVDYMLRALHHLKRGLGRADFRCLLVGAGDALEENRRLAHDLELDGEIRFTGWVPHAEVGSYLSAADLCVAPEPSNPYNDRCTVIKLMEYMALGRPIVAFDLPEHRRTARDAALYARPNSPEDMAAQIARLMDDEPLRRAMGERGRQLVRDELAWPHQVPHLLGVYRTLTALSARRRRAVPPDAPTGG